MTATTSPVTAVSGPAGERLVSPAGPAGLAAGVELLGEVEGTGYRNGVAMVRRADGQMVQLGPLMYNLLACLDGQRQDPELAEALSLRLGRGVTPEHVRRLLTKLSEAGLLAGTEHLAPPRRNPLLALRWKVKVTNPRLTAALTQPFLFLFRPMVMWPVVAGFVATFWFVLVSKGLASGTAQAFHSPGLLLLVFGLTVVSAGFHELGHAAACRYAGATPGGMGMGLYLVWPAFYTDVTDAYRLPRKDRLRVDLAGLYFNALVADLTMIVWLFWRVDALLLLVGLQVLLMVKQLSPIIRADGYHILSDATGVPNLFAHMGPTLRLLLPWRRREPSALTGRARVLVTAWVLVLVPVMLSLALSAVLLLPHLAATAWDSGRQIALSMPAEASHGHFLAVGASVLQLIALAIPVAGSALVAERMSRSAVVRARAWSKGLLGRQAVCVLAGAGVVAALGWAWWPSSRYQPITPKDHGTIGQLPNLVSSEAGRAGTPGPIAAPVARPVTHLAVALIPTGRSAHRGPIYFFILGQRGQPPTAIVGDSPGPGLRRALMPATAFPFNLTSGVTEGEHTSAVAVNHTDGGSTYEVAYSLVTVSSGSPVTETNNAEAVADCQHCTTVAVSFQVVLVVGQTDVAAPVDTAQALNYDCPACSTTAVAEQMVVTLKSAPSQQLLAQLQADLAQLGALSQLGPGATPAAIQAQVSAVEQEITTQLQQSGIMVPEPPPSTATAVGSSTTPSTVAGASATTVTTAPASTSTAAPTTTTPTTAPAGGTGSTTTPTTAPPTTQSTSPPPTTVP